VLQVAEVQAWLEEKGFDGDGGLDLDEQASTTDDEDEDDNEEDEKNGEKPKTEAFQEDAFDEPLPVDTPEEDAEKKALLAKVEFLKYCKSALLFIARIERACIDVCDLLLSKVHAQAPFFCELENASS